MARQLRPVELEFADTAPLRLSFTADLGVRRETVYTALAEELETWPTWFEAVTAVTSTREGEGRRVALKGGRFFEETIMAAQPSERYAYRVDETNVPGVRALLEDWTLAVSPSGGTRVRWTMAVDGPVALRVLMRLGRAGMGGSFSGAMRGLEKRLAARVQESGR
ncbi:SRPBCC family protein [Streptomyces iconiensis]|uniref:SRPBCC family protein n=1 Tax=Streptomyces iconiensis TaxID=1384038 RepID=A0ABT6ZSD8_9ACTN|nr:SRPBCC family protein [Streptomyces iconiensis]MDJ1131383.1 SRPBCC family protein [Streptomyces iconiensis]